MSAAAALDYPQPVKLTVEDFELLFEAGAFRHYHKTELLDGEIVAMNSQYAPHAFAKSRLAFRLADALRNIGSDLEAIIEGSVAMRPVDEPQPDIALTRAVLAEGAIPLETVALVVEISDTTVASDTGRKLRIYARHGIPEYWVVDLPAKRIRQFWGPSGDAYDNQATVPMDTAITAITIAALTVETDNLAV